MKQTPYVIFTDLDGTLLDHESYSHQPAQPALAVLRARNVPLVLCTSKTRLEVEAIRAELGNEDPFIIENGAAVVVPHGCFPFPISEGKRAGSCDLIQLGVPYEEVVAALRYASESSGCPVRGFHDMSVREVAARCGLTLYSAELAKAREYDEPFEVLTDSPKEICCLLNRIEVEGLTWTRGGRFYHIRGDHNKGQAVVIVAELYRRLNPGIITVGLGDSPNDISLLETVDVPIVLPSPYRENVKAWRSSASRWRVGLHAGPEGWNQAVLQLLEDASRARRVEALSASTDARSAPRLSAH